MPLGVVLGSAVLALCVLDSLVFAENRYHLSVLTFTLLAPQTWAFLALYFVVALAIEAMLALWVWKRTARSPTRRIGRYLALGLGGCFLASHLIHAWAEAHYYVPVTSFTRYLPLYYPAQGLTKLLARLGLVDRGAGARARRRRRPRPAAGAASCNYPLAAPAVRAAPPIAQRPARRDRRHARRRRWRPTVAPRMAEFAQGAIRFDAHYSGGNSSRAGMFSLFYGIPATYWDAFADLDRPPGADGPLPAVRLPARRCSPARPCTAGSSGSIGRRWPASRTCAGRRSRPIRDRPDGTGC